ncbi:uncharacterized protein LOC108086546 [Drosophila ficusphila]|uniref:uncharacterized protein LOC108086546 n=1 Tax=Drosophila ficusphila TaxID=30025 RepID=UPI0007E78B55|nr:uncharacterized protein LOC108086546 [Drosophila ficusphila]
MFFSLSALIINNSEIEANLFGMADDVYSTIEIFKEAVKFEARIARPYKMVENIIDCLVFMVVALMIVAFTMHDRIVALRKCSRISKIVSQRALGKEKKRRHQNKDSNTSLLKNNNGNAVEPEEDESIGNPEILANDDDTITLQPLDNLQNQKSAMVGTPKWAENWLSTIRNKAIGSIFDGLFR